MERLATNQLQTGLYKIKNVDINSYAALIDGDKQKSLSHSRSRDSDEILWNIGKTLKNKYTIQSNRWAWYAYASPVSSARKEVQTRKEPYEWDIELVTDSNDRYAIHPAGKEEIFWSLENGNEKTMIRFDTEQKPIQWHFVHVDQSKNPQPGHAHTAAPPKETSGPSPPPSTQSTPSSPSGGRRREIVFSMDVGSFSSVISYLRPGNDDPIRVKRWPRQDKGYVGVPSLLRYQGETCIAFGAAAKQDVANSILFENFKDQINKLPTNDVGASEPVSSPISIGTIYKDWLKYLFDHAALQYGSNRTEEDWRNRLLIFTIPNGWTQAEQAILRKAICGAGCVESERNILFATESNASLHFLLKEQTSEANLLKGTKFVVCNAGRSTIDVALYQVTNESPLEISEKKNAPATSAAADLGATYDNYQNSSAVMGGREDGTPDKQKFDDTQKVTADKAIEVIIGEIDKFLEHEFQLLILVGGFFRNDYIPDEIKDHYDNVEKYKNLEVLRPATDGVADGALIWYLGNKLTAHAMPFGYGGAIWKKYNPNIPGIEGRQVHSLVAGKYVKNAWRPIVNYGDLLKNGTKRRMPFVLSFSSKHAKLNNVMIDLYAADHDANPHWVLDADGELMDGYRTITRIKADLSSMKGLLNRQIGEHGFPFYELDIEVEVNFTSTNLDATVYWTKEGKVQSTTATLQPPTELMDAWTSKN